MAAVQTGRTIPVLRPVRSLSTSRNATSEFSIKPCDADQRINAAYSLVPVPQFFLGRVALSPGQQMRERDKRAEPEVPFLL